MAATIKPPVLTPALSIYDCAALYQCSHKTIRRMIADGRLPAVKIGAQWRIRPTDANKLLTPAKVG